MSRRNPALTWDEKLDLRVFQDDNYTSVEIWDESDEVIGTGHARRDPNDEVNYDIGLELAMARAFQSVANHKQRRADGLVKHAEDVQLAHEDGPLNHLEEILDYLLSCAYPEDEDRGVIITNEDGVVRFDFEEAVGDWSQKFGFSVSDSV